MLIDSHCHLDRLDLTPYEGNLHLALTAAKKNGIDYFLCVAVDLGHIPSIIHITEQYPNVFATVGLHPNEIAKDEPDVEKLIQLAQHHKVVGIGETGLDYYRNEVALSLQQQRFRAHIQAAKHLKKPLVIHTRQARADTLAIMRQEKAAEIGGVMHCFTENWEMAQQAIDLNFYISFSGIITFKNATELMEVVKKVPLERMLIETDAPYLAPVPYRGKPNEPAYVRFVAEQVAALKNVDFAEVAEKTTENFARLFKVAL